MFRRVSSVVVAATKRGAYFYSKTSHFTPTLYNYTFPKFSTSITEANSSGSSGEPKKPFFDREVSEIYGLFFQQHVQAGGPWKMMLDAVQEATINKPELQIIDLASGPGEPGLLIAQAMPHAQVMITDISSEQIELANKRCEGTSNVSTAVTGMEDLSSYATNSFDIVTSCYGYMFCDDKQKAFNEALRVLKPGGTLVATYWKNLTMMDIVKEVMTTVDTATPWVPPMNPMSLSEDGLVSNYLESAGYDKDTIRTQQSTYSFVLPSENKDFLFKALTLVASARLKELQATGMHEEGLKRGRERLFEYLNEHPKIVFSNDNNTITLNGLVFEMIVASKKSE